MYAACARYCDKTHLGTVSSARKDTFFIYQTLLLYVKCFDKTTALCLLKAWFIDVYSSTCCTRNKLLSYFSKHLQIPEIYRKIRETLKPKGKEMAVNMLQSFPAVWAKVPSGLCPCLSTISSLLLLQTWPWVLSHTEQNNTGMKIMQKAILPAKIQISHHLLLACQHFAGQYFGDCHSMKPR